MRATVASRRRRLRILYYRPHIHRVFNVHIIKKTFSRNVGPSSKCIYRARGTRDDCIIDNFITHYVATGRVVAFLIRAIN